MLLFNIKFLTPTGAHAHLFTEATSEVAVLQRFARGFARRGMKIISITRAV